MIKQIKRKFIMTAMIAITILLLMVVLIINAVNYKILDRQINDTLDILSKVEGNYVMMSGYEGASEAFSYTIPKSRIDVFLSSNFFVVKFDRFGNVSYCDTERTRSIDTEEAIALARAYYDPMDLTGHTDQYSYIYTNNGFYNDTYAIFLDTTAERGNFTRILVVTLGSAFLGWWIMFVIVIILSKKMLRPIAENIERQKEFITNAGHELKTPLAVIQANTEALEMKDGSTKYSSNIKKQVQRLSSLMSDLLVLSKMSELKKDEIKKKIDISAMLDQKLEEFKEAFDIRDIKIIKDIEEKIYYEGISDDIQKMFEIFIDNAQKYTTEGGEFFISLKKENKKIFITFKNTSEAIDKDDLSKLFDRFYRTDESHNQKGGFGIGLALAKTIIENHHGKVIAKYEDGYISFILTLGL